MVTISDIAAKSHVSRTLVSRALNNKPGVSPATREKILAVIKELNYRPNAIARSLVRQKTQTIGVVMDNLCDSYFFGLIQGLQETAEDLGYSIIFCSGRGDSDIKLKYFDFFAQGRTDGVIAYGSYLRHEEVLRGIAASNPSFVLIEGTLPNTRHHNVLVDNFRGAYEATAHLIKAGYRRIRHFTGDMNYKVSLDRFNGFVTAMHDFSMPIEPDSILYADFYEESGYAQMTKVIKEGNLPDAVFFGADRTAFGAIRAMSDKGLKTPDDIAIIGFDDDQPQDHDFVYPKLSTLRQPLYEMGAESVRMLIDIIAHPDIEPVVKVFEPELIIRDTCH